MSWPIALVIATSLFLAYANGANDNFKGVATLYGSGLAGFRVALAFATVSTFAGALTATVLAPELIKLFSGAGLVPDDTLGDPAFLSAVVLGAGITVFVTAKYGIPISTTHALIGGLTGAGLAATYGEFEYTPLVSKFVLPLGIAPLIPIILIGVVYPGARAVLGGSFRYVRRAMLIDGTPGPMNPVAVPPPLRVAWRGRFRRLCDVAHFFSAGAVSFARGLNDAPKIAGIVLAAGASGIQVSVLSVATAMAIGGLLGSRPVAETMAHKITGMSPLQGAAANAITAVLVLFASKLGVPVSTTHVSVGAIFGIGAVRRKANWRQIGGIVAAWIITLPAALVLSATSYAILKELL